jgi:hypothetical protein
VAFDYSYEPVGAIADLSALGGYGQYRQRQFENDLQQNAQAMQAQQMAQQAQQHAQGIYAQLYAQQMHGQQMAQQQWLEGQRQAALQQQHAGLQQQLQQNQYELAQKQHAYSMQYGQYGQQMLQIDRLMGRGMTYSDTQQKQVDALDAAWQKVRTDPAAGPDHKQQAWENYIAQKSQIVPMKEPPPPPQETLDKNIVKYKFPDGTEVAGTLGMRNGSLEFKRIENPNETQQNKVAIVQQQLEHKHAEHQMDLQAKQEQAQLDAAIKRQKMQMDIEAHRAKMTMQREHEVSKAYEDLGKKRMALQKPDLLATPEQRAAKDKQIQDNEAFFKSHYGQDFAAIAPDIAAQMGIEFKPPAARKKLPLPTLRRRRREDGTISRQCKGQRRRRPLLRSRQGRSNRHRSPQQSIPGIRASSSRWTDCRPNSRRTSWCPPCQGRSRQCRRRLRSTYRVFLSRKAKAKSTHCPREQSSGIAARL